MIDNYNYSVYHMLYNIYQEVRINLFQNTCTGTSIEIEIGATFHWPVTYRSNIEFYNNECTSKKG